MDDAYLQLAEALRHRIDTLVAEEVIGSTSSARPSRDVLDAAAALEKLQRVERVALGLNDRDATAQPNVVILIPRKLTPEEWQYRALSMGKRGAGGAAGELRSATAEGGGHGEDR